MSPLGFCECGCGERTKISPKTDSHAGHVKGRPLRFVHGHQSRPLRIEGDGPNPSGICMCGCGEEAPIAVESNAYFGYVAGKAKKFIAGHSSRVQGGGNRHRFEIDPVTGCCEWYGSTRQGYGSIRVGGRSGATLPAHRVYWERHYGPVPNGHHLHHICGNSKCVNVNHLVPVTPTEHSAIHAERRSLARRT